MTTARRLLRLVAFLSGAAAGDDGLSGAYARQLAALLPPGSLWRLDPDGWIWSLLLGLADEFARIDQRAQTLVAEWLPDTAVECLGDWERVLGLPDLTFGSATSTEARRLAAVAKFTLRGGSTGAYYASVAARMGFASVYDEVAAYTWRLRIDLAHSSSPYSLVETAFCAGSSAGDPLTYRGVPELEAVLRRLQRATTIAWFAYA